MAQMECSVCKAKATIKSGEVVYSCDHKGAAVVAKMSATFEGRGGMTRRF